MSRHSPFSRPGGFTDEVPAANGLHGHTGRPRNHALYGHARQVTTRRRVEGPRGAATRSSVVLRYASYLLVMVIATVVTGACFASVPGATTGGEWMLLSASFQLVTAAIGSFFLVQNRNEIIAQVRSYVFGYTVLPGTGIAIFMWAARHLAPGTAANPDVFVNSLNAALPWLYFLPIILPAVIFLKTVAGMRMIHREQLDDQEMMKVWTRNDHLQR